MSKVKYIPAEIDGVNQEEECERLLVAADVCLDPAIDGYGNVRDWILNAGSTDHHSGWRCIIAGQQVNISENKESRSRSFHENRGTLYNCGTFIID